MERLTSISEILQVYEKHSLKVVPVKGKQAVDQWTKKEYTKQDLLSALEKGFNVGIITGADAGIIDVDFEIPIDPELAFSFLPMSFSFGRGGKITHIFYKTTISKAEIKIPNPFSDINKTHILEVRNKRVQYTIAPPSIHPNTLEKLEFFNFSQIVEINPDLLFTQLKKLILAWILKPIWHEGIRHNLALPLVGALVKNYSETEIEDFIRKLCQITRDNEINDRLATIKTTIERIRTGSTVQGVPTLKDFLKSQGYKNIDEILSMILPSKKEKNEGVPIVKVETNAPKKSLLKPKFLVETANGVQLPIYRIPDVPVLMTDKEMLIDDCLFTVKNSTFNLVAGYEKVGKTRFLVDFGLAISGLKKSFLGYPIEKHKKTLYFATEDTIEYISSIAHWLGVDLRDIMLSAYDPDIVKYYENLKTLPFVVLPCPLTEDEFIGLLSFFSDFEVVIIDTLSNLVEVTGIFRKFHKEMSFLSGPIAMYFKELSKDTKKCIYASVHLRKNDLIDTENPFLSVAGRITRSADDIYILTKDNADYKLFVIGKYVGPSKVYQLHEENRIFRLAGEFEFEAEYIRKVFDFLKSHPTMRFTASEIAENTSLDVKQVQRAIEKIKKIEPVKQTEEIRRGRLRTLYYYDPIVPTAENNSVTDEEKKKRFIEIMEKLTEGMNEF